MTGHDIYNAMQLYARAFQLLARVSGEALEAQKLLERRDLEMVEAARNYALEFYAKQDEVEKDV